MINAWNLARLFSIGPEYEWYFIFSDFILRSYLCSIKDFVGGVPI